MVQQLEFGINPTITGLGLALPNRCITNVELAELATVPIDPGWVESRTGIQTRHWAEADQYTSDLATEAGRLALDSAGLDASQLTAILVGTITPDYATPSVASITHGQLGASESCNAIDFSAACAGSVKGLEIASALVGSDESARVLVIGSEVLSKMTNPGDRKTLPLFADGAGAAIVQAQPNTRRPQFVSLTHPETADPMYISCPEGGMRAPDRQAFLTMTDGRAVADAAGAIMFRSTLLVAEQAGMYDPRNPGAGVAWEQVSHFVPHQANGLMVDDLNNKLGVPVGKRVRTVERYGNTSSASVLMALATIANEGGFKPGGQFLSSVAGAGFVGGAAVMTTRLAQ